MVETIHATLEQRDCLPAQHIADTRYSAAAIFVDSQTIYGVDFITSVRPEHSWQYTEKMGFDVAKFQIDWERKKVLCPMGKESSNWTPCPPRRGHKIFYIHFRESDCRTCAAKATCTRGKRRSISVQERELVEMIKVKRAFQQTDAYQDLYRQRAGIEGSISQAAWTLGMQRSRYSGLEKTHLQNVFTTIAINLTRSVNWLLEKPLS